MTSRSRSAQDLPGTPAGVGDALLAAEVSQGDGFLFVLDRDLRYLVFSEGHAQAFRDLYGTGVAVGKSIAECMTIEVDREAVVACAGRALAGETFTTSSTLGAAGRERSYAFTWSPLRSADGAVSGAVLFGRDVTAQRAAQDELAASERRLRSALDSMLDPHVLLEAVRDGDGRIVDLTYADANRAACAYMGMAPEDLVGATVLELLPGQASSGMLALCAEALESGEPLVLDDYAYPHEIVGSERRYSIRGVRVGDALSFTWRDVTERHEAELRLAESEELYRLVAENVADVVLRVRMPDLAILWVSPSSQAVIGWAPEQLVGRTMPDLVCEDDLDEYLHKAARVVASTTDGHVVQRLRRGDGTVVWAEGRSHLAVGPDGVPERIVSLRVIEAEMEARIALAASEELYRSVVSTSHEAIFVQQPGGRIVAWNDAATRVYGIAEATALSSPDGLTRLLPDVVCEDGSSVPVDELPSSRTLATGEPCRDLLLGFRRGDEQRWISVSTSPLFEDGDDTPRAVVVSAGDVTDARAAEHALRRVEAARDAAERAGLTGVMQVDFERDTILWSRGMYALYDIPVDGSARLEVDTQTRLDAAASRLAPGEAERFHEAIRAARAGTPSPVTDLRVLHRDGGEHVLCHVVSPVRGASGRVVRLDVLCQDVTAQVAAASEIARLTELRDKAEAIGRIGAWEVDITTLHSVWSPELYRLLDVDPEGFDGDLRTIAERIHPDDRQRALVADFEKLREGGAPRDQEFRVVHRDGSVHVLAGSAVLEPDERGELTRLIGTFQDVTEQRAAAAEIARLEALREFGEQIAKAGSFEVDIATETAIGSPGMFRLYDWDPEDFDGDISRVVAARVHPDDLARVLEKHASVRAGDDEAHDFRVVHRDGSVHTIHATVEVVRGEHGEPLLLRGHQQDVTEQRAAEAALRESEDFFRYIFDRSPVGKAIVTLEGRITVVNDAVCAFLGFEPEELVGTDVARYTLPEDEPAMRERLRALLEAGADDVRLRRRFLARDGSIRWGDAASHLRRDAQGQPLYYLIIVVDVTEEVAAADEILRLTELRDKAEEVGRSGSFEVDLDTMRSSQSPGVFRLFDIERASFTGDVRAMLEHVHPEDRERLRVDTDALRETGVAWPQDIRVVHRDGTLHMVRSVSALEPDERGEFTRLVGLVQDVTEQRALEERLRHFNEELTDRVFERTAQLEAANRELEAFLYSAAHDLRTPLRAIDGFSELVASGAADRLNEAEQADLQRVRRAAQHMALLLDRLVALSRSSQTEPAVSEVDVTRLAIQVCADVCGPHPERDVELVVAPGLTARTDALALRSILTGLIDNAWKFTSQHESARIEVGAIEVGGETAFFVRDDGAGFDPAAATHLFGPFQRYHDAVEFPGDGIGLAVVQRLLTRLGGLVWAEAEVEKGATFYFTLGDEGWQQPA